MTILPTSKPHAPALSPDLAAVIWLGAVPMLAALWLPWVLLRPNRLALGQYQHLPPALVGVGLGMVLALLLAGRWFPKALGVLASAGLMLGFWWLGSLTGAALQEQSEMARASASSGVWLWLLGAAVMVYGAGQAAKQFGGVQRLLNGLWLPLLALLLWRGGLSHWSVIQELGAQRERFGQELVQHLRLVGLALGFAVLLGAPLAVWAAQREKVARAALGITGSIQTIPSLALLGLLIAPLSALASHFPALRAAGVSGIGSAPALCAMTLYALLPIVRNGVVALRGVNAGVLDAARGMGMTDTQRFWRVQLPLALPVWLSGVRQAAVLLVGVASVAQLIGAGGLGYFIFSGMQSGASDLILLGAIPAALLAVGLDTLLRGLERWLTVSKT